MIHYFHNEVTAEALPIILAVTFSYGGYVGTISIFEGGRFSVENEVFKGGDKVTKMVNEWVAKHEDFSIYTEGHKNAHVFILRDENSSDQLHFITDF